MCARRREPTGCGSDRAAPSRRRSPPRPSAPRSTKCRREPGAGCAAWAARCHAVGSTPWLLSTPAAGPSALLEGEVVALGGPGVELAWTTDLGRRVVDHLAPLGDPAGEPADR